MNIYLLTAESVLGIVWLYSLYAIMNPEKTVRLTIDRNMKAMKFYRINATMKPTKESAQVIRSGHILILILATIYMFIVYLGGEAFMKQFIK